MSDNNLPSQPGSDEAMPTWVKVFGAVALVIVVVVLIALLSGGEHGPGRHTGSGTATATTVAGVLSR